MHPRSLRFFAIFVVAHFLVSETLLVASMGWALNSDAGTAPSLGVRIMNYVAEALVLPITLARRILPEPWAPRYGFASLAGCSLLTAAVVTFALGAWQRRFSPSAG